jgi:hypothetical protein
VGICFAAFAKCERQLWLAVLPIRFASHPPSALLANHDVFFRSTFFFGAIQVFFIFERHQQVLQLFDNSIPQPPIQIQLFLADSNVPNSTMEMTI